LSVLEFDKLRDELDPVLAARKAKARGRRLCPVGGAPLLIHRGVPLCLCTRYEVNSEFTLQFFDDLGRRLTRGDQPVAAFVQALAAMPSDEETLWRDLACVEILARN